MTDIYFRHFGSGDPIVLIHGFCETGEIWNGFVDQLSQKCKLLIPDLPGFGKSPLIEGNFSIDDIANTIYERLMEMGVSKCRMIGHSLGGYVTLSLASQYPEMLTGFGLFHSTALQDTTEKKESRNKTIAFIDQYGSQVFAESFAPALFYEGNRKRVLADVNMIIEMASKASKRSLIKYTEAMRDRKDQTEVLLSFDKPILFIAGEYDTSVPLEKIKTQIPLAKKASVHILKDTAHMGMFEWPEKSLTILEEFISL